MKNISVSLHIHLDNKTRTGHYIWLWSWEANSPVFELHAVLARRIEKEIE